MSDSNQKSESTDEHHRMPRLSASKMERVRECSASHARSWEMHRFLSTHKIDGLESGAAAAHGTSVHALLAQIPFSSAALDMGEADRDLSAVQKVSKAGKSANFDFGDKANFWFCVNAILKRDKLIEHAIREADGALNVTFAFDNTRMPWDDVAEGGLSGLADVLVKVERPDGGLTAVIVDYKSLYGEHAPSATNVQLTTLAVLSRVGDRRIDRVYVSLIGAGQRNEHLDAAVYDSALLDHSEKRLAHFAQKAVAIWKQVDGEMDEAGQLSNTAQAQLEAESKVGHHCLFCDGLACCTKLRKEMDQFQVILAEVWEELGNYEKILANNPDIMTSNELSEVLLKTRAITDQFSLFEKLDASLSEVARKLITGGASVEGVSLKEGRKEMKLLESVVDDSNPMYAERVALNTTPTAVFEKLKGVIQAQTGEDADRAQFINTCCRVSPTDVKTYLAVISKVTEKKVFETLLEPLGENNPFEIRTQKATVVVGMAKEERKKSQTKAAV